jgi:hypothetical protein
VGRCRWREPHLGACLGREPVLMAIEGLLMFEVSNTEELYRLLAPVLHTMWVVAGALTL